MTATTALIGNAHRARPRGIERIVMRVSLTMLRWARRRADRTALTREDHLRHRELAIATQAREHAAALRNERAY